jgi:acid phosphatase
LALVTSFAVQPARVHAAPAARAPRAPSATAASTRPASARTASTLAASGVTRFAHVLVVVMENHSYDEVKDLPYTAQLCTQGVMFTNSHAVAHPSQPNYVALWSGNQQGVTNDTCPAPGSPFTTENLGHACEAAGLKWKSYSEGQPTPGFTGCNAARGLYSRNHAPWANFSNLDHANERPFSELALAESLGTLPDLAFVVPDKCHDTHDCTLQEGDSWLAAQIPAMLRALGPHGLLVLTWDEDDHSAGNHILTVFCGQGVKKDFVYAQAIDHYNVLRTICEALGLSPFGAAVTASPIADVWLSPESALRPTSWGGVKSLYHR